MSGAPNPYQSPLESQPDDDGDQRPPWYAVRWLAIGKVFFCLVVVVLLISAIDKAIIGMYRQ
jgi:hypothetical protein